MNKGTLIQFLKGNTTHRFPKIVTLAVASSVLVAMVTIDASAVTRGHGSSSLSVSRTLAPAKSGQLTAFRRHGQPIHTTKSTTTTTTTSPVNLLGGTPNPPTTTTTNPLGGTPNPPTTTTTAPTTTTTVAPAPTTTTTVAPAPTTTTTVAPAPTTTTTVAPASTPNLAFATGTPNSTEPSGYAPPAANALAGYAQTYVTDFAGTSLPSVWGGYQGQPGGDPGGMFDQAHVTVSGGLLQINTYQDPAFNNAWVTGGACLCGIASQTYGAYFVRSRLTGPGPTGVELLWPTGSWPPEIDFNETYGGSTGTSATLHYGASNSQIQRTVTVNMTQWHTWGVIWTPASITYTVDGNVWGTVTAASAIPNQPMFLSLQSQTWCSSNWACPTTPQSMLVDWAAQYKAN